MHSPLILKFVERSDESGWSSRLVAWKGTTKHHTIEE